jgi:hypothetical protein
MLDLWPNIDASLCLPLLLLWHPRVWILPGVWISIFLFYVLALSLRNFTGFNHIVLVYIQIILLRNTKSRSNRKIVARMINQWFWCKYFAHNFFILHSECSEKNYRLPILDWNTATYHFEFPVQCACAWEGRRYFVCFATLCHNQIQSLFSAASINSLIVWTCKTTKIIWIEVCKTMVWSIR